MKKMFIALTALVGLVAFSAPSFAANQVQVTLTSPTIYKAGTEKAGSVTFSFDEGSVISAGDWWYMDLPNNVTVAKDIDYVIAGVNGAVPTVNFAAGRSAALISNAGVVNHALATESVANMDTGPLQPETAGPGATAAGYALTTTGGNMAFQVLGTAGARRIALYALTADAAPTLTVSAGYKLDFKILDGAAHNVINTANPDTVILLDVDGDSIYGEQNYSTTADEVITGDDTTAAAAAGVPYVENTLCINAESYGSDYVYVSFASKNDKFTFTGDSQIAHTAAAGALSLKSCKGDDTADIEIGGQGSTCSFDYEAGTSYCSSYAGNRIMIEATSGAFGDIDDKYTMTAEIVSPADGVYFTGAATLYGVKSTEDECDTMVNVAGYRAAIGSVDKKYQGTDATPTGWAGTSCTVKDGYRIDKIETTTAFELDDFDTVVANFSSFAYDSSAVTAGEEVQVKVTLNRYPCGQIFEGTRTIGTFVTSCGSASTTTLYFPWFPGSAAAGWWGGFAITNVSKTAGVVTLTYYDADGKSATYTSSSVAAGAQFNSAAVVMADLTDVDGFDSTKNYSVVASCGFTAKGFAFNGNGREGVGYTAD